MNEIILQIEISKEHFIWIGFVVLNIGIGFLSVKNFTSYQKPEIGQSIPFNHGRVWGIIYLTLLCFVWIIMSFIQEWVIII